MTAERLHQQTWARVALALIVVGALALAGYAAVVTDLVDVSWGAGKSAATPSATPSHQPTPTPKPTPSPTRTPAERVLDALETGALPTREGILAKVADPLSSQGVGPHVGVAIRDALTGKLLYGKGNDAGYVPASTTKIVTATAVLAALGPQHRFETKVVEGAKPGQIVLVGGGDPLLATKAAKGYPERATIEDLAAATAKELKKRKLTQVDVLVDANLFKQPISPQWEPQYVPGSVVSRITALWVNEGRTRPGARPRSKDPARAAGQAFAEALVANGIKAGASEGTAANGAEVIARVESAPLDEIVEHVLTTSDNEGAEVLARHVALSQDLPATFGGAIEGVQAVLGQLGVDATDLRIYDGSGLSRQNKLTPNAISSVLALAAHPDHPELRAVLTGLPVAGFSGTLDERFGGEASDPGEGVVRAKTGTLTGIASLAGVVTTKDGALLTFALMADRTTAGDPRLGLDRAAAALATCGCR
ncbi:D-alanyl-D-alanine carboxypeptidase/D-alanyl-D-alanine endopeptidase [Tenggerimyces flavus]|uniref:D-alanyl-D-alanine carboxypeptidase/D-alanyl-D-alanine-endopeptidase n=1 Tax=Tenggerimyces flavus TaxID=1708749 RepID=A0ABV7YCZ2_9ACTN|nr:D-alanyl-D-alanine carboxypeptidase/D-alanyl-D-alanine-endopeptidase [Tenggerimyces flavus]MBM7791399.1 D-alanyl-D-alanine carboxypeptidase/D-alanyl-D-alanine-endopeptidase (penicillin-binding protein 4) [Tenggerimyces flavus]